MAATSSAEAASPPAPASQALSSPKVVAFYYTWFDESSWNGTLSDQPYQGYISRERAVMGRHIEQAQQAGIDAFVVAWYGPTGQYNQTEPNLVALLEEAAIRNFKIGILFETNSPFFSGSGDVTTALSHALGVHAPHPAFLRADDGRPVLFFWRTEAYPVETWRGIRSQVDPGHSSVWIGDGVNTAYLASFEGHHLYSNTWNPATDLNYTNQKFATQVRQASAQFGVAKSWVATVMPGYNDVGIRPGNGFAHSRDGGAYFDRSWQAAIDSQPGWIVINSFNEWPEGTYIEPSVTYGDMFLQKSAQWSQAFKQGSASPQPAVAAASTTASAAAPQTSLGATSAAEARSVSVADTGASVAVGLLNLRRTPSTDGQVLSILSQGTPVTIINLQGDWVQIETNDQSGWVFATMIQGPALQEAQAQNNGSAQRQSQESIVVKDANAQTAEDITSNQSFPRFIPYNGPRLGQTVRVDVSILNLRTSPGTNSAVLTQLPFGAELVVEDASPTKPEWIQVRAITDQGNSSSSVGWVFASMVK